MTKLLGSESFDPETTTLLGTAFERAWLTVQASQSPLAQEPQASSARQLLATEIIRLGKCGERNINHLVEAAIAALTARPRARGREL